jgi:hypothetical protein
MTTYLPTFVEAQLPKLGVCYSSLVTNPGNGFFATCGPFIVHIANNYTSRIVAGQRGVSYEARDGEANSGASFLDLVGLCFVGTVLYLVDRTEGTIRKIVGTKVTTFCGPKSCKRPSETKMDLLRPHHVVSVDGMLYISDTGNRVIRVLNSTRPENSATIGTVPVSKLTNITGVDGSFETCTFVEPVLITSSNNGQLLYVVENGETIRQLDLVNRSVTTIPHQPISYSLHHLIGLTCSYPVSFDNIVSVCYDGENRSITALRSDGVLLVGHHSNGTQSLDSPSFFALLPRLLSTRARIGFSEHLTTRLSQCSFAVDDLDTDPKLATLRNQFSARPTVTDLYLLEKRPFDEFDGTLDEAARRSCILAAMKTDTQFLEDQMRSQAYILSHHVQGDLNARIHFQLDRKNWNLARVSSFCSTPNSGEWLVANERQLYLLNRSYEAKLHYTLPPEVQGYILWLERIGSSVFLSTPSCLLVAHWSESSPCRFVLYAGAPRERARRDGPRLDARFNFITRFTSLNGKLYLADIDDISLVGPFKIRVLDMATGMVSSIDYSRSLDQNLLDMAFLPKDLSKYEDCLTGRPTVFCALASRNAILIGEEYSGEIRILDTLTGLVSSWRPAPAPGTSSSTLGTSCMLETFRGVLVGNCEGWKMLDLKTKKEHRDRGGNGSIPTEGDTQTESPYALLPAHETPISARFINRQQQLAILSAHTLQIVSRTDIRLLFLLLLLTLFTTLG